MKLAKAETRYEFRYGEFRNSPPQASIVSILLAAESTTNEQHALGPTKLGQRPERDQPRVLVTPNWNAIMPKRLTSFVTVGHRLWTPV